MENNADGVERGDGQYSTGVRNFDKAKTSSKTRADISTDGQA